MERNFGGKNTTMEAAVGLLMLLSLKKAKYLLVV